MPEHVGHSFEVRRLSGEKPETLIMRLFDPVKDLEPLERLLSPEKEALPRVRRTILKGYRRFPWGFFVVINSENRLVANLQLGFFKPWWLVMAMGRQPLPLPDTFSRVLASLKLLDKFHVANIQLDQAYRGSGLADQLMDFAENHAKVRWQRKEISLLVNENNTPALKLYQRKGYLKTGTYRKGRIEKLEMTKSLA